jgi:hypothetical protein
MKRKDEFRLQTLGGEQFLVPLGAQVAKTNGVVLLNAAGSCIWEHLAEPCSVDDLTTAVMERFDVDGARARADVQTFLTAMSRLGLLEE